MRSFSFFAALVIGLVAGFPRAAHADVPATEFFAIETSKLAKLAPGDADLEALSSTKLAEVSIAHGWYRDGLSMRFDTATFRMDARFTASAFPQRGSASIGYNISASNDPSTWNLLAVQGLAARQGGQFITENWRAQPVTVILRFLDLKK